jgi:iron complex outermembrane receptor protein
MPRFASPLFCCALLALPCAVLAATATPTAATTAPAEPPVLLAPLQVTAVSGVAENLTQIPMTVELVSPARSVETQPLWLGEIMNRLPGVFFAQFRGPVDAPAIRLPVSVDNTVLNLEDGIPLQSPVSFTNAAFAFAGALTSLGGVEVLKGPGTALHGSDAFAAVINVKSLAPTEAPSGSLRVAGGSYGAAEARGEISRSLAGGQSLRLAGSLAREDGWRNNTGWERSQAIVRHRWAGGDTEINTILLATDFDSQMSGMETAAVFNSNPRHDGLAASVPRDRARDTRQYFRLSSEITRSLSPTLTAQATPYVRHIGSRYMNIWQPAIVPVTAENTDTAGLLARLYASWSDRAQTVFGVDVEATRLDTTVTQILPSATVSGSLFPTGRHYDYAVDYLNLAPYLQHTEKLGADWVLVAGLRYEDARYDYDNHLAAGAQDAFFRPADRTDRFHALNPSVGLTWQFQPRQSFFARYAHGFRIPSAERLYALNSTQTAFTLRPEQVDSYELGYKGALGDRAALTVSAYFMRSHDGLTTGVGTPAGIITANGGRREYSGLEAQLAVRLDDDWSLTLAAAVQDATILRDQPGTADPRGVNGKTPNSLPSRLANLSLNWTPSFAARRITVDFDTQLIGAWWIDDQNTQKTSDEFIVNLRARYVLKGGWTLTAKALNLLDRHYATTAANTGFGARFRPGNPLTVMAGIERAW